MIEKINLNNILFLDIETVPETANFNELDSEMQALYEQKTQYQRKDDFSAEEFYDRAGIWAEFGKIVCISVGFFVIKGDVRNFRVTSFFGDEAKLLKDFNNLLNNHFNGPQHLLCGHNAKEFDIPYICRRLLINGLKLPSVINIAGKKPWEIAHLDTLELWKFGDYKAYTSLSLLCHVFGIPTPKDDISGADVARVYYENDAESYKSGLERVKAYCEKDVLALVQLFLRMRGDSLLNEEEIYFAE